MRRTYRKSHRRSNKSYKRKKTASKSRSGKGPSVHNSMPMCIKLFKKYKLTNQGKMVKWMTKNHPDHAKSSNQSSKLKDDYKFITGCFANRKRIFQAMKSSKTKSKSKSKSKKKVKGILW